MSSDRNERRLLDANDEAALPARTTDDLQSADEITRHWLRGRSALRAYLRDNLPQLVAKIRGALTLIEPISASVRANLSTRWRGPWRR